MATENPRPLPSDFRMLAVGPELLPRRPRGLVQRHDGPWIRLAQPKPGKLSLDGRHRPRGKDGRRLQSGEFRHPFADEVPFRIVVLSLLDGIVNAHRVDPGDPGLHLELGEVNARLKVEELPGQMLHPRLPRLPEVVGQETQEHGPHPEIQISRLP